MYLSGIIGSILVGPYKLYRSVLVCRSELIPFLRDLNTVEAFHFLKMHSFHVIDGNDRQ
jgi:hypothetical protein